MNTGELVERFLHSKYTACSVYTLHTLCVDFAFKCKVLLAAPRQM